MAVALYLVNGYVTVTQDYIALTGYTTTSAPQ